MNIPWRVAICSCSRCHDVRKSTGNKLTLARLNKLRKFQSYIWTRLEPDICDSPRIHKVREQTCLKQQIRPSSPPPPAIDQTNLSIGQIVVSNTAITPTQHHISPTPYSNLQTMQPTTDRNKRVVALNRQFRYRFPSLFLKIF